MHASLTDMQMSKKQLWSFTLTVSSRIDVCVLLCAYEYMYTHVLNMHAHMYTCIFKWSHMCVCIHVTVDWIHAWIRMDVHACIHKDKLLVIHMHAYVNAYMHTQAHTYIHIWTPSLSLTHTHTSTQQTHQILKKFRAKSNGHTHTHPNMRMNTLCPKP